MLMGCSANNLEACTNRYSFTNWVNVLLVIFLKYLQNDGTVMLTISDISSKLISSLKFAFTWLKTILMRSLSFTSVSNEKPSAFSTFISSEVANWFNILRMESNL